MPRPGQVIIRDAHRGGVSIAEYPRTEAVGVSGSNALNLGDGHRSILIGVRRRNGRPTTAADRAGESDGWPPLLLGAHSELPHLVAISWYRKLGQYQNSLETPANGPHVAQMAYQKRFCKSVLSHGFSWPSENRGVPGSIPGLAISNGCLHATGSGGGGRHRRRSAERAVFGAPAWRPGSMANPSRLRSVAADDQPPAPGSVRVPSI